MAVRVGFEPTIPREGYNAFRERRLRPLGHLTTSKQFRVTQELDKLALLLKLNASPLPQNVRFAGSFRGPHSSIVHYRFLKL